MSWWKRFGGSGTALPSPERLNSVQLDRQGWSEEASGDLRVWRDSQGDVLSLAVPDEPLGLPDISDALENWQLVPAHRRNDPCSLVRSTVEAVHATG